MARRVPSRDLVFYAEFDGLDAHARDWKGSAAYKALNQTTLGALLEDLAAQGLDRAMKGKLPDPPKGSRVVQTLEFLARKGFALAVNGRPPEQTSLTLLVRGGSGPEVAGLVESLKGGDAKAAKKTIQKGIRQVTLNGDGPAAGAFIDDGGDLILVEASTVDRAIAVLEGKEPNASGHPSVLELAKPEGTFRPVALAFVDPKVFPPLPPQLAAIGLDGLKRVDYRWGFRDDAIYGVFRLLAPSPRRGVMALFDGPSFDKATLPPLPAGVNGFTVASISPARVYDKILAAVRQAVPDGDAMVDALQRQLHQVLGVMVRQDLLSKLGPKWSMYAVPSGAAGGLPLDVVVLTDLADPARFAGSMGQVLEVANDQIKAARPAGSKAAVAQFRGLAGGPLGFELVLPPGMLPPGPLASLKPTILMGKKSLAIASSSNAAASAIALAEGGAPRWKPDAAFAPVLDSLPKGLVLLSVSDPRESLPQLVSSLPNLIATINAAANPGGGANAPTPPIQIDRAKIPPPAELSSWLFPASVALSVDPKGISLATRESLPSIGSPATAGVTIALLLPAVQSAREAARRAQCINNLKRIGLAFQDHESTFRTFPNNIHGKDGKPLLSWRVAILPYLEQEPLYRRFKLDEPWDSPNNKPLLKEMPSTYACPSRSNLEPGLTTYRGWAGPAAFFGAKEPVDLKKLTDGASNTLAVVEAAEAVAWTKPDDLPFDPKSPLPLLGAGSTHPGGFNALFVDGIVRFLKGTTDPAVLRALITIGGGEVVPVGN